MGKLRELQSELKDYVAEKREERQERKAERRAEVRERARMLRDGADIFERRLLHSHPDIRKSREDLLTAIRARLNESETEAKKAADELFGARRNLPARTRLTSARKRYKLSAPLVNRRHTTQQRRILIYERMHP